MGEIVKASCKCQRRGMRLGVGMMFYYECDEVMEKHAMVDLVVSFRRRLSKIFQW